MPLTALHAALGLPAGRITHDLVLRAVEAGAREGQRLDWKSSLPPQKHLSDTDFPKDVAAFANAGGGVIIYGVAEADGAATVVTGAAEFSEGFERSMRDCVLRAIQPAVYNVQIEHLRGDGMDLVAVTVPESPAAPHMVAMRTEQGYRVPRREGSDTIWMSETVIADAYARRFAAQAEAVRRLDDAYELAAEVAAGAGPAWFIAAAVPVQPSWQHPRRLGHDARDLVATSRLSVRTSSKRYIGALPEADNNVRATLRGWRTVLPGPEASVECQVSVGVFDDGGVSLAAAAGGHRNGPDTHHAANEMDSRLLESFVIDLFSLMEQVGGDDVTAYDVKIGIERTGDDGPFRIWASDEDGRSSETGVAIQTVRPVRLTFSTLDSHAPQIRDAALDVINQGGVTELRVDVPGASAPTHSSRPGNV